MGRSLTTTTKAVPVCDTTADALCATDLTATRTYTPATGPLASEANAKGDVTAYEYDSRGRASSISRGPSVSDLRERITYTYDAATGRKSAEHYFGKENGAWVEKRSESFTYDSLSQLITQTHPDNTSIGYSYDEGGAIATVRDENHAAANTRYGYDPAHRLISVRQTLANAEAVTTYSHDVAGNLTAVTDPNGNVTTYVYDDFGRMLSQSSPVTGTTMYSYDKAGNLASTTDANSATTIRTYDALGRVTSAVATRGSASESVTWTHDGTAPFARGRLVQMTDPAGSTAYAYDRRGLLLSEVRSGENSSDAASYQYDRSGNRITVNGGITYNYDYAGRPLSVQNLSMPLVSSATYLPFGPLAALVFGNGTTKSMTYDARYRPLTNVLTSGAATLSNHTYTYDAAGNITSIADQLESSYNRTFGYDDLNRLTSANSGTSLWGTGSYTYDAMGNMLTAHLGSSALTFSYQGTTPKVTSATDVPAVTYDNAGNEVGGYRPLQYSPRNLLTTDGDQYDGRGVRARRDWTLPPATAMLTTWTYSPELRPLRTVTQSYNGYLSWDFVSSREFVWFSDLPVAQIDAVPDEFGLPAETVRYTFTDHLGTPILQTDDTGTIKWRAEYDPYGHLRTLITGNREDQPLRLPGQEAFVSPSDRGSIEPGEYYNIFRWYRSGWGRYTQADPLYMNSETSLYAYVDGNPIRWKDRLGLDGDGPSWDYQDGPWHPDRPVSCSKADDCPTLKTKIGLISRTIASHRHWDAVNLAMGGTGDRHVDEIKDWVNAINKCKDIYEEKCRNTHDGCKPCKFVKEMGPVMLGGYIIYKAAELFFCPPLVPLTP
jgi:RHS repeat-associated protein